MPQLRDRGPIAVFFDVRVSTHLHKQKRPRSWTRSRVQVSYQRRVLPLLCFATEQHTRFECLCTLLVSHVNARVCSTMVAFLTVGCRLLLVLAHSRHVNRNSHATGLWLAFTPKILQLSRKVFPVKHRTRTNLRRACLTFIRTLRPRCL